MMKIRKNTQILGLCTILAVLGLGITACGDKDEPGSGSTSGGGTTSSPSIKLTVTNTDEWNTALNTIRTGGNGTAEKLKAYTITVSGNVLVSGSTGNSFGTVSNVTVTLKGNGKLYIIGQGSLLTITNNQTVYIDSTNLTLEGLKIGQNGSASNNTRAVVYVAGGTLELLNGTICGNTISGSTSATGSGVHITNGTMIGNFIMSGGTISDNTISASTTGGSGGVYITGTNSSFTMSGGTISGNTANNTGGTQIASDPGISGGVCVSGTNSSFTMTGGTISGNTGSSSNYVISGSTVPLTMTTTSGGGVYVSGGCSFTMSGGTIGGNTGRSTGYALSSSYARYNYSGGGVFVANKGTFAKTGGIIYGNNADANNNTSTSTFGNGNAVYFASSGIYRNATLGEGDSLSTSDPFAKFDPTTLSADTWADGNVSSYGEQWFRFTATADTQYIHVSFDTLNYLYVQVYDSNGNAVGSSISPLSRSSSAATSRILTSGQVYYVRITPQTYYSSGSSSYSGTYRIAFNSTQMPPVSGTITTLSADTWADGNIPQSYGEQWFSFTATADTQYIHVTFGTLRYVQVYDSSGSTVGNSTYLDSSTRYTSRTLTSGQVYFVRVWSPSSSNSGTYQIAFNASATAPAQ